MNGGKVFRHVLCWLIALLMAAPLGVFAAGSGGGNPYSQQQLEQLIAPIALYPDAVLAQVLMASTYPLEVVQADRWVKQNSKLKGDALSTAVAKMDWDQSVKALVQFPDILSMMNKQLDWMQSLGDAFIAQQKDVMDTVQKLRASARAQNNLNSTREQTVIVEDKVIRIEPANPQVIYVPSYDPAIVYGVWPYPAYPPYYVASPVVAAGVGFVAGVAVGAAWSGGWGYCNWGGGTINIYNGPGPHPPGPPPGPPGPHPPGPPGPHPPGPPPGPPGPHPPGPGPGPHPPGPTPGPGPGPHPPGPTPGPHPQPGPTPGPQPSHGIQPGTPSAQGQDWQHDPSHRKNVPYRDDASRQRYTPQSTTPAGAGRDYRGYTPEGGRSGMQPSSFSGGDRMYGGSSSYGRSGQSNSAFEGMGSGRDAMEHSDRGRMSRESGFGEHGGGFHSYGGGGFHGGGGGFHGGGGRRR